MARLIMANMKSYRLPFVLISSLYWWFLVYLIANHYTYVPNTHKADEHTLIIWTITNDDTVFEWRSGELGSCSIRTVYVLYDDCAWVIAVWCVCVRVIELWFFIAFSFHIINYFKSFINYFKNCADSIDWYLGDFELYAGLSKFIYLNWCIVFCVKRTICIYSGRNLQRVTALWINQFSRLRLSPPSKTFRHEDDAPCDLTRRSATVQVIKRIRVKHSKRWDGCCSCGEFTQRILCS